jgi:hypothetical protein
MSRGSIWPSARLGRASRLGHRAASDLSRCADGDSGAARSGAGLPRGAAPCRAHESAGNRHRTRARVLQAVRRDSPSLRARPPPLLMPRAQRARQQAAARQDGGRRGSVYLHCVQEGCVRQAGSVCPLLTHARASQCSVDRTFKEMEEQTGISKT